MLPLSPTNADIKSFLEMNIHLSTDPDARDDDLRVGVIRFIPVQITEF